MPKSQRIGPEPFTVATPVPLDVEKRGDAWWATVAGRELRLSNLRKIFWPAERYTKGDLIAYYHAIAPRILPYLAQRPLTMKRMPDGIDGPFFYEKSAPSHVPDWVPRCPIPNDQGEITDYMIAADEACLLLVANLGAIEFHPLHSRCGYDDRPDYLFFDLDPMDAPFEDVRTVARHVRAALDALGLPSYPKTSGATGMQIYVPIVLGPTYDQTRAFVGAIGRMILKADPARVTMEWEIAKRTGKIFIDHNMNRPGANIAAVYSVRPEPGATVSTPVTWDEVEQGCVPQDFTIVNTHERLARVGDLFAGVLDAPVDLRPALERLHLPAHIDAELPPAPRVTVEAGTPKDRRLAEYIKKRDLAVTPEPGPGEATHAGDIFVIHKHNATRLHYDLRLEHDGALESWAVPKGLPTAPGDKRLAVHTEPHPLEYADFSGWIPEGHYGAGESLIFDRGTIEKVEWKPDKVTVRLHGRRVRGEYHLVKTNQGWLIFLSSASASAQPESPPQYSPMLADAAREPFDDPKWRFEPKLDGIRALATITTDATKLISRNGRDLTPQYPEIANLAQYVNAVNAVIDGEIVTVDDAGRPSFERLQQRMGLTNPRDIDRIRKRIPVAFYAFDLLFFDGNEVVREPIQARRDMLERIVTETDRIKLTLVVDGGGVRLFEAAKQLGFEGVVAKRLGSSYQPGRRSKEWIKIKATNRIDCVVLGWTPGEGSRSSGFGSLLVGAYRSGEGVWIGQVGTGFTDAMIADYRARLEAIEIPKPAFSDPALREIKGARWTRPEIVCDVEYLQLTDALKLRAPSFKGLRPDKAPEDCVLPEEGIL